MIQVPMGAEFGCSYNWWLVLVEVNNFSLTSRSDGLFGDQTEHEGSNDIWYSEERTVSICFLIRIKIRLADLARARLDWTVGKSGDQRDLRE